MSEKRDLGLLCHKTGDKIVFFLETNIGPFIYVVHSGIEVSLFMNRFQDLQQDRFFKLSTEEAHECQLELSILSETSRFKD